MVAQRLSLMGFTWKRKTWMFLVMNICQMLLVLMKMILWIHQMTIGPAPPLDCILLCHNKGVRFQLIFTGSYDETTDMTNRYAHHCKQLDSEEHFQ